MPQQISILTLLKDTIDFVRSQYYCGYTFKGQTVGRKYLLLASKSYDYMEPGLESKTDGQRRHRVLNRLFTDMHHRCCARTAAEEVNLAANSHDQDVCNAEYSRTCEHVDFPGGQFVKLLEHEEARSKERKMVNRT